jgi:hypothetical protein
VTETRSAQPTFREAFNGWHSGLIQWTDYDAVMARVAAQPEGWYVYDTREDVPTAPVPAAALPGRIEAITRFLRDTHRADYCGFVYADDRETPTFVKVYNPRNASACGMSSAPLPVFTLSRMPPEALPFAASEATSAPGLVARLFGNRK